MSRPRHKIAPLIAEHEIHARVAELAREITAQLGPDLLVVALLRGSFVFAADLLRALHAAGAAPQVDFMTASSYGSGTESTGAVTVYRDLTENVAGRNVLLLDDILESGRTLDFARGEVLRRGATSAHIGVLLEKPNKRADGIEVWADFVGFSIPDRFVVGYGLDYANYYRELPFIGVVEDEA